MSADSAAPSPVSSSMEQSRSRQPAECLQSPQYNEALQFEHSVHLPSRLLRNDIELVFRPDLETEFERHPAGKISGATYDDFLWRNLLVVPTWQPGSCDLSEICNKVNQERKDMLEKFDAWASGVRARLGQNWSDASCPMEGNARFGNRTSAIYNELEGLTQLLKYDSVPVGCCGIVLHPLWQRQAYPVTFFSTAPLDTLKKAIADTEKALLQQEMKKSVDSVEEQELAEQVEQSVSIS